MMSLRNIVLVGASGNLGAKIFAALTSNASLNTTVVTRQSSAAQFDLSNGVNVIKVGDSYPPDEMIQAFAGQDAVVLAISAKANAFEQGIIDSAIKAGVKRLIPSHWASNAENPAAQGLQERTAERDGIVQYLKSREAEGMTWTAVVPGLFFDFGFMNGLMGFHIPTREADIWDDGESTFSVSTTPRIAEATVSVLLNPSVTANRYVYISSFETSQNNILACVQEITGADWKVSHVDSATKIREALHTSATTEGLPRLMAQGNLAIAAMYGSDGYGSDFVKSGRSSNEMLGLATEKLEDVIGGLLGQSKLS